MREIETDDYMIVVAYKSIVFNNFKDQFIMYILLDRSISMCLLSSDNTHNMALCPE